MFEDLGETTDFCNLKKNFKYIIIKLITAVNVISTICFLTVQLSLHTEYNIKI